MDKDAVKSFVAANPKLVTVRESISHPGLFVLKYKKRVFFDNLWNDFLEECRGTIVDADYNTIQRPFTKIYNFGVEDKAPKLSDDVKITGHRKVNGFMAAITVHNDELLISTTGSTDSDFINMIRDFIDEDHYLNVLREYSRYTAIFECCHENDPHIIPEKYGMYLLGYREKDWEGKLFYKQDDLYPLAEKLGCNKVEIFETTVGELKELVKTCRHEGFVAYTENGEAFKIKSPWYLTNKWVARNPKTDKLMRPDFKNSIDEEYYPLLEYIRANIEYYTGLNEQERLEFVRNYFDKV